VNRGLFYIAGTGFAGIAGFVTGATDNPADYQQQDKYKPCM
jgi:hypothetical protein